MHRSQLANAAVQVERAAGGLGQEEGLGRGQQRSSSSCSAEMALACRSLLGMLSQELWRKQALVARLTAALGPLFLFSASSSSAGVGTPGAAAGGGGYGPVEAAVATTRDVVQAWPLEGAESFVDMVLGG